MLITTTSNPYKPNFSFNIMKTKITFLGTGTATPTAKRNHPGVLISHDSERILIDCGEGIQRQMQISKSKLTKLTRILITHWHGDHTLGIPGLLETLHMAEYSKTLHIYGPKGTKENLAHFEKIYGKFKIKYKVKEISKGKFLDEKEFFLEVMPMTHSTHSLAYSFVAKDKLRLNKTKLKKLKLPNMPLLGKLQQGKDIIHPKTKKKIRSSQVTFLEKGKKVSVIMDTVLNPNTIKIAKNSDILISEASFSENEEEKAKLYKHLTASQAATIAKKAKAKKLFLIHISKRYEHNLNPILKEAKKIFKSVTIPKDLDTISI